jgi:type II secretory pathway predicted ATPase ExeA
MFETHFAMKHRPFRSLPDTQFYYPASGHEQVLTRLAQAVRAEQGIAVLCGAAGTGKTLLCHCLLERLDAGQSTVFLTHSHFADRSALLQGILYDLGKNYEGKSEQELRLAVTEEILNVFAAGKYTLMVLDEAQNLSAELLEELRLLSNLESRDGKAVQILLVGQPELLALLRRPQMEKFRQRVAIWAVLDPLPAEEAIDYLNAQVRAAGVRPDKVITAEALKVLADHAGGVPRILNHAAHEAFVLAAAAGADEVDAEAAMEAVATLGSERLDDNTAPAPRSVAREKTVAHSPVEEQLLRRLFPTEQPVSETV